MDVSTNLDRRRLLRLAGAGGVAIVGAAVGIDRGGWTRLAAFAAPADADAAAGQASCVLSPAKTEGPYFVDEKLNRSDIRIDPSDGSVQAGIPLQLTIRVYDSERGCAAVEGATVDMWHANAQGTYSDVAQNGTVGKKYLRGLQTTDASGTVRFTTIYPGWYQGRAIHIHFKVRLYDGSSKTYEFTSQIFFDEAVNTAVMNTAAYQRGRTRDTLNSNDSIYGSDGSRLTASASGTTSAGYAATFDVGLTGLPAGAAKTDSTLTASLTKAAFDRTPNGRRRLTLALDLDESVAADVRLVRGTAILARRRYARLKAGTRQASLVLASKVAPGSARAQVTLTDAAGNAKVLRRAVRVPAAGT
jgi:protocatechuate 3,4-dioxygenase beta subunit